MFKCQACNTNSLPREKANKVLMAMRDRTYINENGVSKGWEIKEEWIVGKCCLDEMGVLLIPAKPIN